MKSHSLVLLLIFFSIGQFCTSQNAEVDSLIRLAEEIEGIEKAKLYNDVAEIFLGYDPGMSLKYAEKAYEISAEEGSIDDAYYSLLFAGNAYSTIGQHYKAVETHLQSLEKYGASISPAKLAQLHNQLGSSYQNINNFDEAIKHLLNALKILEQLNNEQVTKSVKRLTITTNTSIGTLFSRLKNYPKALDHYKKAMDMCKLTNDSSNMMILHNNIGITHEERGNHQLAIDNYFTASMLAESFGSKNIVARISLNISLVYVRIDDYVKALDFGQKALRLAEETSDQYSYTFSLSTVGHIYLLMNKPDLAIGYLEQGIELAKANNYANILGQSYDYLSRYYAAIGDFKRAYETRGDYFAINDSLNDSEMASRVAELQTKYETEKKEQEIVLLTKDTEIKDLKIKRQNAFTYALIGVVVLIIIIGLLWFGRLKEKQMREKTELEKINLETEQKLLRAQINPHFMFNALNSVQSYISANDNLKAMSYLAKFSQLMRNILENSRKTMITIEEEVNTLSLYMELEAMRFKDAFEFEVKVSGNIVPSRTYIPPMLIQPFVENAIKHGFRDLDRKGKLMVDFFAMNGVLSCRIEDNGIGRAKALAINQSVNGNHNSLGMTVIQERLTALSKARKVKAKCEIEDLETGTRVLLDMPFEVE